MASKNSAAAKKAAGKTKKTGSSAARKTGSGTSRARSSAAGSTKKRAAKAVSKASERTEALQKEYVDYKLVTEIFVWILLAVSVLLFISLFGFGAGAGKTVSGVMFGLFGAIAYVFPFLLFFLSAFFISNSYSRLARIKGCGILLLYVAAAAFADLFMIGYQSGRTPAEHYEAGMLYHTGGGLVGGSVSDFFCRFIGTVGCVIILILLTLISLILITQKSILSGMKKGGKKLIGNAREHRERLSEWENARSVVEARRLPREEAGGDDYDSDENEDEDRQSLPVHISILPREDEGALPAPKRFKPASHLNLFSGKKEEKETKEQKTRDPKTIIHDLPFGESGRKKAKGGKIQDSFPGSEEPPAKGKKTAASAKTDPSWHVDGVTFPSSGSNLSDEDTDDYPVINLSSDVIEEEPPFDDDDFLIPPNQKAAPAASGGKKTGRKKAAAVKQAEETEDAAAEAPETSKERSTQKVKMAKGELEAQTREVEEQIASSGEKSEKKAYVYPPVSLLSRPSRSKGGNSREELMETAQKLTQVFKTFGVNVKVTDVTCGPSVTRYELIPEMGVKVSKIMSLQNDIQLNLAASDIRIEAPIPGKSAVGIEVPNKTSTGVSLREMIDSDEFRSHPSKLAYTVGRDIAGNIIVSDLARMPHLLVAGATGSGKSVFINTLIMSIIFKASPDDVKMIMIDPKVVELSVYNGIPHLYIPVVTDPKKAAGALNWAVAEMTSRYNRFAEIGVRDIKGYNKRVEEIAKTDIENKPEKMPQIVVIVDELADLMMVSSNEVEEAICRLTQLARAAGIHLVIATQRPSVDVITGLIKANMPSRIAFAVSSGVDSRTILDMVGAEKLLGRGDMLFAPQTFKQPLRVQGAFISDEEVAAIVDFLKENNHEEDYEKKMEERAMEVAKNAVSSAGRGGDVDELFADAGRFIIEKDKASIGNLQRYFKIGFNRAARIMDQLCDAGVVGPEEGTKPRKVLMSEEQFENYLEQN